MATEKILKRYRKDIEPTKIKDLNFDIKNFAQHHKKKRPLLAIQRKNSIR